MEKVCWDGVCEVMIRLGACLGLSVLLVLWSVSSLSFIAFYSLSVSSFFRCIHSNSNKSEETQRVKESVHQRAKPQIFTTVERGM